MCIALLHFTLLPLIHRFVALIANANLALTHPVTSLSGFSHFNAIFFAKSFMTELASRERTPSIEVTKGVKDACPKTLAKTDEFQVMEMVVRNAENNKNKKCFIIAS